MDQDLPYWIAFNYFEGIGPVRFKVLLDYFGTAKAAYEASEKIWKELGLPNKVVHDFLELRRNFKQEKFLEEIKIKNIKVIKFIDKNYPELLRQISDCPPVLYVKGELLPEDNLAIGIVGTRKITSYGREATEILTRDLVASGLTIVSGMALGVDTVAHQTAIEAGGRTIAVVGTGVDLIYPPENKSLYEKIIQHGAVVSEVAPGNYVARGIFPARNRIISGLSLGVVVTEGAQDSGSMITAKDAASQGREVFAVPGPITSYLSAAPSILIKNGAKLVYKVSDILDELKIEARSKKLEARKVVAENPDEEKILKILANEQVHIDNLVRISGLETGKVSSLLTLMEIKGKVKKLGGMMYCIAR